SAAPTEAAHLPPLARGDERSCFAAMEPNTTRLKTRARRDGDGYVVGGQKVWISAVRSVDKMLLLARTTSLDQVRKPTHGLSMARSRRGPRDRKDGPQGGGLELGVLRWVSL